MVAADWGINLNRESVRVRPQRATRHLRGMQRLQRHATKGETTKIKTGPPHAYAASTISMATQNLINMVVVFAVSGTILLGLLAAKHF